MRAQKSQNKSKRRAIIATAGNVINALGMWQYGRIPPGQFFLPLPPHIYRKTLCVREKDSKKEYILQRSYIHHPIYEVLKFYFMGQDSDWQTMESILW